INSKVALSHYNGLVWTRVDLKMPGEILDMCTDLNGNIWACGRNGVVLKYDKIKWIADTVKILNYNPSDYFLKSIEYYNGKIYLLASIGGTRYANLTGDIKNWTLADTMRLTSPTSVIKWGNMGLYKSSDGQLYTYGLRGIWSMTNSGWEKIFDFDGEIYGMYGASKNYLLGVSGYRSVCFFDGFNWNSIGNLFNVSDPTFEFKNVWTDGYEIFLVGFGTINGIDKTIIWHGK
ncbi:MAG: hypothetical protein M1480_15970, partial [Bacteroidetes bacterium]|nr:hypothetical protein [Bacteroidota bacterium]